MKILLIEDDPASVMLVCRTLEDFFKVDVAQDGYTGEVLAIHGNYQLILIDTTLQFLGGVALCRRIRAHHEQIPLVLLGDLTDIEDKLAAFDAGADDFICKPFEPRELLARVKSLCKRAGVLRNQNKLVSGDLVLDLDTKTAVRSQTRISLTAKEFMLLEYFMRNRGRVIGKMELSEKVWDLHFDTGTNVVEVYVNILRKKIDRDFDPKLIHTRVGLGYLFQDPTFGHVI